MDKTFEEIIGEVAGELTSDQPEVETDVVDDAEGTTAVDDEAIQDDDISDEDEVPEDLEDDEEEATPSTNEKDNQAFARMRTELKEANTKNAEMQEMITFFDERAKQMGLGGIQGLIDKTKEAELSRQSQEKGIPLDVLKRLNELEDKVKQQDLDKQSIIKAQKEQMINQVLDEFVQEHKLDEKGITALANEMAKDGFNTDTLMEMPKSVVTRILNSYVPKETVKQELIAKKEKIKKEMPITTKNSSLNTEDDIDKIAKLWAGNY